MGNWKEARKRIKSLTDQEKAEISAEVEKEAARIVEQPKIYGRRPDLMIIDDPHPQNPGPVPVYEKLKTGNYICLYRPTLTDEGNTPITRHHTGDLLEILTRRERNGKSN